MAMTALSVSNCRTTRPRDAPIANRIDISRDRDAARAIWSPAMFAHVINSTSTVIAMTASSGVRVPREGPTSRGAHRPSRSLPCFHSSPRGARWPHAGDVLLELRDVQRLQLCLCLLARDPGTEPAVELKMTRSA